MKFNPFSLKNKKILITRAFSGIEKATAIACSKIGATVFITGRDKYRLKDTFWSLEYSLYSTTKGSINGFIKGVALDLAPKKIRVNLVNPGMINTDLFEGGNITKKQLEQDKLNHSKEMGNPQDVAYAVITSCLMLRNGLWVVIFLLMVAILYYKQNDKQIYKTK